MEEYDVESILDMYEESYVPEPRPMMSNGGLLEEYYGKSQLPYQQAVKDGFQGTYEEYLKFTSPTKSFADGGRIPFAKAKSVQKVGNRKGQFTSEAMNNVSDAILKAYAEDDISLLFQKSKVNPTGLISPEDAKQGIFSLIKKDQDRLNAIVKNTGLDQETILDILDDRDAYDALEKGSSSQKTRYAKRDKFFNQAEKWLTTNAKRYSDPEKLEKAFNRTFGKNNLIAQTIKANITEARGKGRLTGFSDDFIKTIMSVREGTTKADDAFNSKQLKDIFKTVIYNYNPNVRKKITTIFENIIPEPGSKRTPDIRDLFANNATLKKFGLDKSIKGPIARLIANEINEDLLTNVQNFQRPFLGTDALLSFLKDRVDPKYKEMFREASNAVKQAQKNQWPEAKKTLNIAQDINFDHKIPKSIIDLGYADEIEYIKLNPTSQKFNQTIKRSQFDTPLNDLIRKFENTKTLDGKAAVVKEMNILKDNFSKKYDGYLDEVTITPDKTGKPIFKSSAEPVTKKTDFRKMLEENFKKSKAAGQGQTFYSNPFFDPSLMGKVIGDMASSLGSPTAIIGLNTAFGVDPRSSLDRAILGTEAALAPAGIKALTSRLDAIKNPLVRKSIETAAGLRLPGVFTPANVLRAARFASPVGIATLAGEGLYQLGKLGYKEQQMINEMRENDPEAYQRYLAEQQELMDVSA